MKSCYTVRVARADDIAEIKRIFAAAREFMTGNGNPQWQDGYPYDDVIEVGVAGGNFRVLLVGSEIAAVFSVYESDSEYDDIDGKWLSDGTAKNTQYLAAHTLAVSPSFRGRGGARAAIGEAEAEARLLNKTSVRMDTHIKNEPMQNILKSLGFIYCGAVKSRGEGNFICFEKLL